MQIKTETLKKDMRFSKDVFFDDGQCLLLAAGNILSDRELRALKQWQIPYVVTDGKILGSEEDVGDEVLEELEEEFGEIEDISNTIYIEGSQLSDENIDLVSKMVVFNLPKEIKEGALYSEYTQLSQDLLNAYSLIKENKALPPKAFSNYASQILKITKEHPQEGIMLVLASTEKSEDLKNVLNSTLLASLLCSSMHMPEDDSLSVIIASLLHKVGTLRLPATFSTEKGELTEAEIQVLNTQLSHAHKCAVQELGYSENIGKIIDQQYECWDGSGYPSSLVGNDIEIGSRIIAVADEFINVLSKKEKKKPIMSYEAIKHLLQDNSHKFDPNVVKTAVQCLGVYPIGSIVLLNDGSICKVVKSATDAPLRPAVQVILSEKGKIQGDAQNIEIDLKAEKDKFIVRTVDPRVYLQ